MPDTKATVLVVDDDPDFRLQQRVGLESAGYAVVEAEGQAEALDLIKDLKPDIAVVDLMMEDADAGFTLCYMLKKKYADVPVILVTGVASETGLEFGADTEEEKNWVKADMLLAKPIRFEQLQKEIDRLLARGPVISVQNGEAQRR